MDRLISVFAQMKISPEDIGYNTTVKGSDQVLINVINTAYFWAGVAVVIVIIISGILFVTSRSDPAQMKRSKDALRGAVIGLVVVLLAFTITRIIIGRF